MNAVDLSQGQSASPVQGEPSAPVTVCYPFAGDSVGGSHYSLLGLLRGLDPTRFRVLIVLEVPNGRIAKLFSDFKQVEDPARTREDFVPGEKFTAGKFIRTLAGLPARTRLLREHKAQIVHTNDGRTHAAWAPAARLAGVPLVWHHRADPGALGLRLLAPALASKVLTVSTFSLPKPGIWSASKKSQVVFSPFDISVTADRAAARRRILDHADLPEDSLLLGYFGSFIDRKRPLLFVDTIAELRSRLTRPVFGLMFGEAIVPEMDSTLREHIRRTGTTDAVRLMGYQSPGHEWIAGCDQLVVPAVGEPLGRTLVEAMLVKTPVVATRSGGNEEALADSVGVLVEPESAASLADGIEHVLGHPEETRQMVERAASIARDRFGETRHIASVTRVYEELLG